MPSSLPSVSLVGNLPVLHSTFPVRYPALIHLDDHHPDLLTFDEATRPSVPLSAYSIIRGSKESSVIPGPIPKCVVFEMLLLAPPLLLAPTVDNPRLTIDSRADATECTRIDI